MSCEPVFECALNVMYILDTDEDQYVPNRAGPSRTPGTPNDDGPAKGYNLRPGRAYYGQRTNVSARLQAMSDRHARQQRRQTPYTHRASSLGRAFPSHHDEATSNIAAPTASSLNEERTQRKEPVIYISSDSEDGEGEEEDDGVPPEQRSPIRVYKVVRAPNEDARGPATQTEAIRQRSRLRGEDGKHLSKPVRAVSGSNGTTSSTHSGRKLSAVRHEPRKGQEPTALRPLRNGLRSLREEYPKDEFTLGSTRLSGGDTIRWGIRCLTCPQTPLITGQHTAFCLSNFRGHLASRNHRRHRCGGTQRNALQTEAGDVEEHVHDQARACAGGSSSSRLDSSLSGPSSRTHTAEWPRGSAFQSSSKSSSGHRAPPSKSGPSLQNGSETARSEVEEFLRDLGLSLDLAGTLYKVGIRDHARMRAVGALPDADLDRVEHMLVEAGLDAIASMLVKNGLKKRAAARTG
ncbi:hypothetical protein BD414DRAFT_101324 [Trametes punicea]|nr:hypothetical protein BD414DRAFT_101324 [Trametes punicea]